MLWLTHLIKQQLKLEKLFHFLLGFIFILKKFIFISFDNRKDIMYLDKHNENINEYVNKYGKAFYLDSDVLIFELLENLRIRLNDLVESNEEILKNSDYFECIKKDETEISTNYCMG